jgi:hypothetical protein
LVEKKEITMPWNHRVVRMEDGSLQICEVYYDPSPRGYDPTPFLKGETIDELTTVLEQMKRSLAKPVLNVEDL